MAKKYIDDCEQFDILDFLGSGAYGAVFAAKEKDTERVVAVKSCKDILTSRTLAKRTLRELRILRYCNHPNIVQLQYVIIPNDVEKLSELNFAFELLDTDLAQVIRSPQVLLVDHVQYFTVQLVSALDFLHRSNIIHRDVKPRNILVNADCTLKLADFGLAKVFREGEFITHTAITDYVTTRWYRAPEVLSGSATYGAAIDMWAVGCILAELFQRIPLFPGTDTHRQLELIVTTLGMPNAKFMANCKRSMQKTILRIADKMPMRSNLKMKFGRVPSSAVDLISRLLVLDPQSRLSAGDCLSHGFLSCTNYPRVKEEELIHIPPSVFAYEYGEVTLDILREELLNEVGHYHPHWRTVGEKEDEEQEGSMKWLPDFDVSSDDGDVNIIEDNGNPYESTISQPKLVDVHADFLEEIALSGSGSQTILFPEENEREKVADFEQEKDNPNQPRKRSHRSASNASISSCQTEIREWVQEEDLFRASLESRHSRMLSKDTIVDGFAPPSDLVDEALKEFVKSNVTRTISNHLISDHVQSQVSSNTVLPLLPSASLDYELQTLNIASEQESSISWTMCPSASMSTIDQCHKHQSNHNLQASSNDMDCKSLLSFGFCSSSHDYIEYPYYLENSKSFAPSASNAKDNIRPAYAGEITVMPDLVGKKRSLVATRSSITGTSSSSIQSGSGELVRKDARHSSCIIS